MRTCNRCKTLKPLSDFGADASGPQGINRKCKLCNRAFQAARKVEKKAYDQRYREIHSERLKASDRARHAADPESARLYKLKKTFGLSSEDEQRILKDQNQVCAVCLQPEWVVVRGKIKHLAVDHNHHTGKVRGFLCNNCNRALGMLDENENTLTNLIAYLQKHRGAL